MSLREVRCIKADLGAAGISASYCFSAENRTSSRRVD
jgi:hypothetical protein